MVVAAYIFAAFFIPLPLLRTRQERGTFGSIVERSSDGTWRATGKPEESTKDVAQALQETVTKGSSELKGNPNDEPGQES
jgi:hypothetical protein